ncbi:hypothetical protein THASP1DRAFT_25585 [Thamnocephalis sphaerospora]|uniref:Uncharacterized protein n=1 Tax=Thamnocephalis sphaerospora TaxID=78915 RepID=A0A4P9XJV5_9FUNG|nr:hypothetical protein THASP1DRAFT_25585 [Thamnocephalis sphaerospora]|eukprot:RKP06016.1 hypothetical protein THASP1DRAFT_25585 [Thamnocephalis sphaerospora]
MAEAKAQGAQSTQPPPRNDSIFKAPSMPPRRRVATPVVSSKELGAARLVQAKLLGLARHFTIKKPALRLPGAEKKKPSVLQRTFSFSLPKEADSPTAEPINCKPRALSFVSTPPPVSTPTKSAVAKPRLSPPAPPAPRTPLSMLSMPSKNLPSVSRLTQCAPKTPLQTRRASEKRPGSEPRLPSSATLTPWLMRATTKKRPSSESRHPAPSTPLAPRTPLGKSASPKPRLPSSVPLTPSQALPSPKKRSFSEPRPAPVAYPVASNRSLSAPRLSSSAPLPSPVARVSLKKCSLPLPRLASSAALPPPPIFRFAKSSKATEPVAAAPEARPSPMDRFIKRKEACTPKRALYQSPSPGFTSPLALSGANALLSSPDSQLLSANLSLGARSPCNEMRRTRQQKRTRVSVNPDRMCAKRRCLVRNGSDPAPGGDRQRSLLDFVAPCTPPTICSTTSLDSAGIFNTDADTSFNGEDAERLSLVKGPKEQIVRADSRSVLSPMSNKILAAVGMRRLGNNVAMECLKSTLADHHGCDIR